MIRLSAKLSMYKSNPIRQAIYLICTVEMLQIYCMFTNGLETEREKKKRQPIHDRFFYMSEKQTNKKSCLRCAIRMREEEMIQ